MDKIFDLKSGVVWKDMDTEFEWDLSKWLSVANFIRDIAGGVPTITSTRGDKHSINSLHYMGKAIDLRINDWKEHVYGDVYAKTIAWLLGSKWLVILESDHLHIQLGFSNVKHPDHIQKIGKGFYLR